MRIFLALIATLQLTHCSDIKVNVPCNAELDGLLASDPDGNENAFMSCQTVGVGNIGFWERKVCPNNMVFDFINQQCKVKGKKARKQQTLNIAILNNSCANGETCIGGSVCDLDTLKCMCPFGTVPHLDTLSCESSGPAFVSAPVDPGFQFKSMVNNFNQNGNDNRFQPNPVFKFENNFKSQNNMNSYGNEKTRNEQQQNNNFNFVPDFNFKPNWNNNNNANNNKPQSGNHENINVGMLPNPSQQFGYGNQNNNQQQNNNGGQQQPKKIATLAKPGASCKNNEVCIGGSVCTLPIGACLCPGHLEEKDGECVLPATSSIPVTKVGIGALCSDLAECDHGSTCVMGRCACLSPLVQHNGKCVLKQQQKLVGPGELCDNGEICTKGSICDAVIPVCVCPADTDLNNGECTLVQTAPVPKMITTHPQPTPAPTLLPVQPEQPIMTTRPIPPTVPQTVPQTMPTQPVQVPVVQTSAFTNPPRTQPPTSAYTLPYTNYVTTKVAVPVQVMTTTQPTPAPVQFTAPPTVQYTAPPPIVTSPPKSVQKPTKSNYVKLGGNKQAGVGVRCSLNTDCMIGAYCNGNTNPPSCQCLSTHVNIEGRCEKVVYPGQIGCRSDAQCSAAHSSTSCIDRVCACPVGQKAVDQTCVPETANPTEACGVSSTNPCSGSSVCFKNACTCPDGSVPNLDSCNPINSPSCFPACNFPYICIQKKCVLPDSATRLRSVRNTDDSLVCWPGAALCSSGNGLCIGGKCHCLKGYVEKNGRCEGVDHRQDDCFSGGCHRDSVDGMFREINSQCNINDKCAGGSTCRDDVCQCVDGSQALNGKCRQQPGGRCANGEICTGGSFCQFLHCRCPQPYSVQKTRCLLSLANPGESCQKGEKCTNNSECHFGRCICPAKTSLKAGRCERILVPTTTHKPDEVTFEYDEKINITIVLPGHQCNNTTICDKGSHCDTAKGICTCKEYEVILDNACVGSKKEAERIANELDVLAPGQKCTPKSSCKGGSMCSNGYCKCPSNRILPSGQCSTEPETTVLTPGDACTVTMECPFRTKCLEGVCRCSEGETIVQDSCRTAIHQVLPGSACEPKSGYDCVGDSTCVKSICICKKNLVSNGKKCVKKEKGASIIPGNKCGKDDICTGGSFCSKESVCKCLPDEVPDVNHKCVSKKTVYAVFNKKDTILIQESTTTTSTTTPATTSAPLIFASYPVTAAKETIENSVIETEPVGTTVDGRILGHTCTGISDCPSNAFCFNEFCNCLSGFKPSAGTCEPVLKHGEACTTSNQCENNGICENGKCICNPNGCTSQDKISHGDSCLGRITFCEEGSYCNLISNVCECPLGHDSRSGQCKPTTNIAGTECMTSKNCGLLQFCDNGHCVCKPKSVKSGTVCTDEINNKFSRLGTGGLTGTPSGIPLGVPTGEFMPSNPFDAPGNNFMQQQMISPFSNQPFVPNFMNAGNVGNDFAFRQFKPTQFSFPFAQKSSMTMKIEEPEKTSEDTTRSFANPLENCENGELCIAGSECDKIDGLGKVCQCKYPNIFIESECVSPSDDQTLRSIGETCEKDTICIGGAICEEGFCSCGKTKNLILGVCVTVAFPSDSCSKGEICLEGSSCAGSNGTCQCKTGTRLNGKQCVKLPSRMSLDLPSHHSCRLHTDCHKHAYCNVDGECECLPNYQEVDGTCVNRKVNCAKHSDCENDRVCRNGLCVCSDRSIPLGEHCVAISKRMILHDEPQKKTYPVRVQHRYVNPGSYCGEGRKCASDSICFMNHCICSYEDIARDDHCIAKDFSLGLNEKCDATHRCMSKYVCLLGKCMCKPFNPDCDPNEPVTSPPGGSCSEGRQCTGGAICKEGWCICPDQSMIVHKGVCIQSGNKPTLPPKFIVTQPAVPVAFTAKGRKQIPGAQCGPLDECVGGSHCISGICMCPVGTVASQNGRCDKPTTTSSSSTSRATSTPPTTTRKGSSTTRAPFVVPVDVMSRRPPAFIELPTHAPLITTRPVDECMEIGLICKGNTICRNKSCQCPEGYILHHDGCVSPEEAQRRKTRGKARHQVSTTLFSKPGEPCEGEQICVGNSQCIDGKVCQCTSESAHIVNGECVVAAVPIEVAPGASCDPTMKCTKGSSCINGQCRCSAGHIAVSGNCVLLPTTATTTTSTTQKSVVKANPLESCDSGEQCAGGSSCDYDTGICMCPKGQIVFGTKCLPPPTQPSAAPSSSATTQSPIPTLSAAKQVAECETDQHCGENKICVSGKCKCRPGFVNISGACEPLEEIDAGDRPVPVSYAKHKVAMISSEKLNEKDEEEPVVTTQAPRQTSQRPPSRQETQKPRVVGPPIRRPKPKSKNSGGSSGGRGAVAYKTGSGNGNCPPGNEPTKDDSGRLITCNGLEPNCPPRSYCYITTGGFATEEYNCCKSW